MSEGRTDDLARAESMAEGGSPRLCPEPGRQNGGTHIPDAVSPARFRVTVSI
jgi:hypothetical protein